MAIGSVSPGVHLHLVLGPTLKKKKMHRSSFGKRLRKYPRGGLLMV